MHTRTFDDEVRVTDGLDARLSDVGQRLEGFDGPGFGDYETDFFEVGFLVTGLIEEVGGPLEQQLVKGRKSG